MAGARARVPSGQRLLASWGAVSQDRNVDGSGLVSGEVVAEVERTVRVRRMGRRAWLGMVGMIWGWSLYRTSSRKVGLLIWVRKNTEQKVFYESHSANSGSRAFI